MVAIPNEEKETALREHIYGANAMPDKVTLGDTLGDELILPRGFYSEFIDLLNENNINYQVVDNRSFSGVGVYINDNLDLRDYQKKASEAIYLNQSGRIISPTGSGKTVIALGAIAKIHAPTIILVDKINIATQWKDRAKEHLGVNLGVIGDGKWEEEKITVATIQTLWSKRKELDQKNWWENWDVVFLDEQHHCPAETYYEIVSRFPATYRIGLSATVGKSPAKKRISELLFGPVLFERTEQIIKPEIVKVMTNFAFDYKPTRRIEGRVIRNNYSKLLSKLTEDKIRNEQIGYLISRNSDHCNLIISRRLKHLENIKDYAVQCGVSDENCYMLTGKESDEQRQDIIARADKGNCAIFSTIADEALDIPRIDRIYLAFPGKNEETIKQQIGRGSRPHNEKKECVVYDFIDENLEVLWKQWTNRLYKLYQPQKLKIVELEDHMKL